MDADDVNLGYTDLYADLSAKETKAKAYSSSSGGDYTLVDPTFAHLSAQKTEAIKCYDAAVAKWETASPEDRPFYKALVDSAKEHLDAANKNLFAHLNQPKVQLVPEIIAADSYLSGTCRRTLGIIDGAEVRR